MELAIVDNPYFLFRWIHVLAGITWIGSCITSILSRDRIFWKLMAAPSRTRYKNWYRGAPVVVPLGRHVNVFDRSDHAGNGVMDGRRHYRRRDSRYHHVLNVWLIIWPAQKIVIASATGVAGGADPLPEAGPALARAGLASRTNTLFSFRWHFSCSQICTWRA